MKAAGCLFIEGSLVLAGYNTKYNMWSGIGGKIESGESVKQAALRETLEELFSITPTKDIIDTCVKAFDNNPLVNRNNYGFILLSFDHFKELTNILRLHHCISPFYEIIPHSITDLIRFRKKAPNAEISDLMLINFNDPIIDISTDLLLDCEESKA